jgi:hypothetical protein
MAKITHDQAVTRLKGSPTDIRCGELKKILGDLGFVVRDNRSGNHKTFTHPDLPDFVGSNFDCGHGANAKILPVYVRKIRNILEEFEAELKAWEP